MRISLVYIDQQDYYRCALSLPGKRISTVHVSPPKVLSRAVDSPQAYDDAAHAAISFETSGRSSISDSDLDYAEHGFRIERKRRGASDPPG